MRVLAPQFYYFVICVLIVVLFPRGAHGFVHFDMDTVYESIRPTNIVNSVITPARFELPKKIQVRKNPKTQTQTATVIDSVKSLYARLIESGATLLQPIYFEKNLPQSGNVKLPITTRVSPVQQQKVVTNTDSALGREIQSLTKRLLNIESLFMVPEQKTIVQNTYNNTYVTSSGGGYVYSVPSNVNPEIESKISNAIAPIQASITSLSASGGTSFSTSSARASISATASGLTYDQSSGVLSLTSGYVIPLTASTTEWASKISSQWSTNGVSVYYNIGNVGIGTSTPDSALAVAGDVSLTGALKFNGSAGTSGMILQSTGTGAQWVATSSLGISGGTSFSTSSARSSISVTGTVLTYDQLSGVFGFSTSTLSTTDIQEGSNLYFTNSRADARIAAATSTIRSLVSTTASGLTYDQSSGVLSLTSGYVIPLTASTTEWNIAYASTTNMSLFWETPSTRITAGTGLSWSGNTLNSTGVTSIGGLTGAIATSSLGITSSQWSTSGSNVYYNGGNVGIGTTTPTSKFAVVGSADMNALYVDDGTTGSPSLSFRADTDTGIYRRASNQMAFSFGGSTRGTWDSTGLRIGDSTAPSGYMFQVMGTTGFNGSVVTTGNMTFNTNGTVIGYSTTQNYMGGITDFRMSGAPYTTNAVVNGNTGAAYFLGSLGVGTSTPSAKLAITGTAGTGDVFIVASSTNANMLVVKNTGRLGLGTTAPSAQLHAISTTEQLRLGYDSSNYLSTTVGSAGLVTFDAVGNAGTEGFAFSDSVTVANTFISNRATPAGVSGTSDAVKLIVDYHNSGGRNTIMWGQNQSNLTLGRFGIEWDNPTAQMNFVWRDMYNSGQTTTEVMRLTGAGNLGIGTGSTVSARVHAISTTEQLRLGYDSSNYLSTTVGSAGLVTFDAVGTGAKFNFADYVGIGTSTPAFPLDVYSTVSSDQTYGYLNALGNVGTSNGTNLYSIKATGRIIAPEFNAVSDARLKDVQFDLDSSVALSAIEKLRPVSFTWKDNPSGQPILGLLAQEVEQAIPNAVSKMATDKFSDQREVSYNQIVAVMIGAIKEINKKITEIKDGIAHVANWFDTSGDRLNVQGMICVDNVCLTKEQFKMLLIRSGDASQYLDTPPSNSQNGEVVSDNTASTSVDIVNDNTEATTTPVVAVPETLSQDTTNEAGDVAPVTDQIVAGE